MSRINCKNKENRWANKKEYFDDFFVDEQKGMSVLALLDEIQASRDSSIYYEGQCGCANWHLRHKNKRSTEIGMQNADIRFAL